MQRGFKKGEEKGKLTTSHVRFGPGNLSVEAEVDLLSYCAREWKGETPRAKLMRKVCLFVKVTDDREFVCKNQDTNIPPCFTKPKDLLTPDVPQRTIVAFYDRAMQLPDSGFGLLPGARAMRVWTMTYSRLSLQETRGWHSFQLFPPSLWALSTSRGDVCLCRN